ncbi:hypothetical protein [Mycetocola sp. JXN-3]|uniref:hypothetical protein n=1 Tax=Mycetocola sp. JXN-3 TaxID=2116510 RepID=UPI00165D200E|nr:hypothetical protein [Mycetocola sp. JXN-3]
MDCLANTGFDSWPVLIAALVVVGLGIYLALRARHTRSGRAALIALPLLLALGLATQSAPPATAASGAVPCASASASAPASASATPSPSLTPSASATPSTSPTPPNDPTPTPTPTPTPAGCQLVNDKSDTLDSDGDGIVDRCDADSDNDGIPDVIEDLNNDGRFTNDDLEGDNLVIGRLGDGVSAYLDLDSDNDSIPDLFESGIDPALIAQIDRNGDGIIDADVPVGANGLADVLETFPDSGVINYTLKNTDGDDKPDFIDLQSNRLDYDMYLVGNANLDILGAGFLSPGVDIDHDGIMDQVDTDTAHRGSPGAVHPTW